MNPEATPDPRFADYATGAVIPEDVFEALYRPIYDDTGCGTVDISAARRAPLNTVWTIVDVDGELYAAAGFHHVNRTGEYVLTEMPWTSGIESAEWFVTQEGEDEEGDDAH